MSADNWGICPKCKSKRSATENKLADLMMRARKENDLDKFEKAKKDYNDFVKEDIETTLREDYECFISEDGNFYISYSGECEVCGFSKQFKIDEQLKL